jgi:hypothetical protein
MGMLQNNLDSAMAYSEVDNLLLQALRRLMKPMVRLFIRKNIPLQVFTDLMKEMYVSTAEESLIAAGFRPTDSQISLMTGVHRRDVREYRGHAPDTGREIENVSISAEIVATWLGNPQFMGAEGQPAPLPYTNDANPEFSFTALAESVSKDVRPRAILDEMLRQNTVRYDEITDNVWLNSEAFIPQEGWAEKLYYLGRNGEDHLEAAVTNVLSAKPPFLDRSVYYSNLTEESVETLQKMSREQGMKLLRSLNRRAHELHEKDQGKPGAQYRMTFGAYFYSDTEDKG